MPKRFIRFNLQVPPGKADLFLRDPNANFMVVLEKKIFALDKQLLMPSLFFKTHIDAGEKSVAIQTHINVIKALSSRCTSRKCLGASMA